MNDCHFLCAARTVFWSSMAALFFSWSLGIRPVLAQSAGQAAVSPELLNRRAYDLLKTNYDSAGVYADSAGNLAKQLGQTPELIKSLITKGISYYFGGSHDLAMSTYLEALSLADSTGDLKSQASALNEMGVLNRKQGDLQKAEENFSSALALGREAGDSLLIANSMNHLGVTYDVMEQYEKAMEFFRESTSIKQQLKDTFGLTYNLDHMGQTAAKMGQYAQGEAYFLEAAQLRKQLADETGYAITINNIGELYLMKNDREKALEYFTRALEAAEKLNYKDFRRHLYRIIGDTHRGLGNYQLALDYLTKYQALNDSIFNEQRSKQILELQTRYETEKKEQEIQIRDLKLAEQQLLLDQKNLQLYSSIGGVGILLILLYMAYTRLQLQKRVQQLELTQKMQRERERISADLHDHVGAQLTSILAGLQITDQIESFQKDEKVRNIIGSLKEDAHETLTSLRASIWSLNLKEITLHDLAEHVERHLSNVLKYHPDIFYDVKTDIREELVLGAREALHLTRAIQEAIHNVLKHSGADRITVTIEKTEKLRIEINDNGRGFDTATRAEKEHYGLDNMRRRVEEAGGTMSIISSPAGGCSVIISI